jgi:hypothetical protein
LDALLLAGLVAPAATVRRSHLWLVPHFTDLAADYPLQAIDGVLPSLAQPGGWALYRLDETRPRR